MIYTLKNEALTVKIAARGAELRSCVSNTDGCEYLWQRDPAYWEDTSPWLFPICSNLYQKQYTYRGKTYQMGQHGFASKCVFEAVSVSDTAIKLLLLPNEQTRACYPFDFAFTVSYRLVENRLECKATIENSGEEMMYATVGAHPGFNVPLGGEGEYTDWYLEFGEKCSPDAVVFTEEMCDSGRRAPYDLTDGKKLMLSHELFLIDGVFLTGVPGSVTLRSDKAAHKVTVTYGNVPYVGVWSSDNGGAFVCVEPWHGMASYEGAYAIEEKNNMFRMAAGDKKSFDMTITFD